MSLHERQVRLEEEMVSLGRERYQRLVARGEAETRPGQALIASSMAKVAAHIATAVAEYEAGKAGRYARTVLRCLAGGDADAAAYIALRRSVQGASVEENLVTTAVSIGSLIEEHLTFETFRESARGLATWWAERAKKTSNLAHARKVMRTGVRINGGDFEWTEEDRLKLGLWLIEALESYGLVSRGERPSKGRSPTLTIRLTDHVREFLDQAHDACMLDAPFYLPMVERPVDWTTPWDGGYVARRLKLVTGRVPGPHFDDLASADLRDVYRAVNAVQGTAWQVNRAVLDVLESLIVSPAGAPGIPGTDEEPLPPRPANIPADVKISDLSKEDQDRLAVYRRQSKEVYDKRAADSSRRRSFATLLYVARRLAGEKAIYFPHRLDSRGRIYSIPAGLSPQGEDISKGLLRFSEGKPMGEEGPYWLAVHLANCYGVDKVPFDERVEWVQENLDMIRECGLLGADAVEHWSQADSPWQFLAACMEWVGMEIAEDPAEYITHLPVGMDGSCSGLQHFSAALRDPVGGRAVNLVPTGKVEDIYSEVAERVNAHLDSSTCGEDLLPWRGHVDRKIVKQPCMTYAYSSTVAGTRDMILAVLNKRAPEDRPEGDLYFLAGKLAPVVRAAIEQTVVAAADALAWLQTVAGIATDHGRDLRWTTPSGFVVLQRKTEMGSRRVSVWYSGQRTQLRLMYVKPTLSRRGQKNAVAPNWVHSMDAAHLVAVTLACLAEGIDSFAMVHDSFGVHACDIPVLYAVIRQTFVEQYGPDRLAQFRDEIQAQLGPDVELPDLPAMGELDLEGVLESDYFFA